MPPKVQLSTKERALFARLIQEYEMQKYHPALKTADAILARAPDHGETIALKGLILFSLQRREEGLYMAKLGVRRDLTSFICWHALGIVYRMDRNYEEALKCYAQALKIEGGNINIVRESALLQLQMRNYVPLIEARLVLLRTQPHYRPNWIALAIAHDVAGSTAQAARVLAGYEDVHRDVPENNYEFSEVVLYHASLLEHMGDADGVLALLAAQAHRIVDVGSSNELRARALQKLGRGAEAEAALRELLARNPENKAHIRALLEHLASGRGAQLTDLEALMAEYPRSAAMRRMALELAQGDDFARHARDYLERALVKNVPSLFSDVKPLYADATKRDMVENIVEDLRQTWDPATSAEVPSSYVWAMYFLAHHYSATSRPERALRYIDSLLVHSPAMPEVHMTRARVLKRAGALEAAADAMNDARLLDGQDRYLNTKTAKYLLRVGRIEDASAVIKLFTRPEVPDPLADLVDMQASPYLIEDGAAHARRGDVALALKRYCQVDKIAQDIYDDQVDFHSYCVRKMTLRAYVNMVRFQDRLFSRAEYVRAAVAAVENFVRLADDRMAGRPYAAPKRPKPLPAAPPLTDEAPLPDTDPFGDILAGTESPLAATHRFLTRLQEMAPENMDTWRVVFEVALRERKWLLAMRALSVAWRLNAAHPRLHVQLLRFRRAVENAQLPVSETNVLADLAVDVPVLGMPADAVQVEFVQRHGDASAAHMLAAAEGLYVLHGAARAPEAAALVHQLLRGDARCSLAVLTEGLALLRRIEAGGTLEAGASTEPPVALSADASSEAFIRAAHALWPHADAFHDAAALESAANERAAQRRAWLGNAAPLPPHLRA